MYTTPKQVNLQKWGMRARIYFTDWVCIQEVWGTAQLGAEGECLRPLLLPRPGFNAFNFWGGHGFKNTERMNAAEVELPFTKGKKKKQQGWGEKVPQG